MTFRRAIAMMFAALAIASLSCRRAPALEPLQLVHWSSDPTDEQIVAVVVGTGGTADERAAAAQLARDLFIPRIRERYPSKLRLAESWLHDVKNDYDKRTEPAPLDRLIRVAVGEELELVRTRAMGLAERRLHDSLFPGEPYPETWAWVIELPYRDTASIVAEATKLSHRITDLDERYGDAGHVEIGEQRTHAIAVNHVHVALTGDYARTTDPVFSVLVQRGVATSPAPGVISY